VPHGSATAGVAAPRTRGARHGVLPQLHGACALQAATGIGEAEVSVIGFAIGVVATALSVLALLYLFRDLD
jgi:hypothetical protein